MRGAIHEAVDRARLLLLAVALLWGCVPTAHALRSPTPLPSLGWSQPGQQLKEETAPFQKTPLFGKVALTLENAPVTAESRTRSLNAFGRLTGKWGPMADANVMQFSTMPVHRQSGIVGYWGRGYDPNLQRWIQRDPMGEVSGINLYQFNFNNPLSYIDPDGMAPQLVTVTYDWNGRQTGAGYVDYHFGQEYGIGNHTPLEEPTLVLAQDMFNHAADLTYDPNASGLDAAQYYLMGLGLGILGTLEFVPDVSVLTKPARKAVCKAATKKATQLEFGFVTPERSYLYQKVRASGEHLKFGVTDSPLTRYSRDQLDGGRLRIVAEGERAEMLRLEREIHETLPLGPEEGQTFYIRKQVEKGLLPPSQYPFPP